MIQDREVDVDTLTDYTTRGGFHSVYGTDSKQYKQAGDAFTSERKPKAS